MENVAKKPTHPLLILAAIAVILFCAAGIAAIMGWVPKSGADSDVPKLEAKAVTPEATAPKAHTTTAQAAKPHSLQTAQTPAAKAICRDCAVIESVREVEKTGDANGVGAVAGGVLGGVVGHQVGSGRGRDVMTVVGAVGGAVAGHEIEKNMKKTRSYQVTVRFEDGTSRVLAQPSEPSWRAGDQVRVVDGQIRPRS